MQKVAFVMKIKEECMDEYIRMHENIWPEMKEPLKTAGRSNYSIWRMGCLIFGYYEAEDETAGKEFLQSNDAFIRWNKITSRMLDCRDPLTGGKIHRMEQIFNLE